MVDGEGDESFWNSRECLKLVEELKSWVSREIVWKFEVKSGNFNSKTLMSEAETAKVDWEMLQEVLNNKEMSGRILEILKTKQELLPVAPYDKVKLFYSEFVRNLESAVKFKTA